MMTKHKEFVNIFNPKNLLVSLYQYSQTPETQGKETPVRHYKELNKFRQRVEEQKCGPHHQPYNASRKKARIYKGIFFALGVLFLFLSYFMYSQTMTWSGTLFFVNYTATKMSICTFTFALSLLSFLMGHIIRTEREATNKVTYRAKNKMRQILAYKKAEFGLSPFSQGHQFKKSTVARQAFHEATERAQDSKKNTYALLNQISETKGLDVTSREQLYNQAILELNDKLHVIIYDFKKKLNEILDV